MPCYDAGLQIMLSPPLNLFWGPSMVEILTSQTSLPVGVLSFLFVVFAYLN